MCRCADRHRQLRRGARRKRLFARQQTPLVLSGDAGVDELTMPGPLQNPYMVRITQNGRLVASAAAEWAYKKGWRKVVTIGSDLCGRHRHQFLLRAGLLQIRRQSDSGRMAAGRQRRFRSLPHQPRSQRRCAWWCSSPAPTACGWRGNIRNSASKTNYRSWTSMPGWCSNRTCRNSAMRRSACIRACFTRRCSSRPKTKLLLPNSRANACAAE